MIDPTNLQLIQQLQQDDIALPEIDYSKNVTLNLVSTTLHAAYKTISDYVCQEFLSDLEWEDNGDIQWQNNMLQQLSDNIYAMIAAYRDKPNDHLLTKIFIWIQLWGGNTGRNVFVKGQGWPNNFVIKTYLEAVSQIQNQQYIAALQTLNQMYGVSTAFASKHIHFWSGGDAPIYDSIIAAIVFGRKQSQVRPNEYPIYISALDKLIEELNDNNVTRSSIERNLFNWADTQQGKLWRCIRLSRV